VAEEAESRSAAARRSRWRKRRLLAIAEKQSSAVSGLRLTLTGRWTPFSPVVQLIEEVGQVISERERETLLAVYVGLLGPCVVITSTGLGLFSAERSPI
jgi:hypothetical protein